MIEMHADYIAAIDAGTTGIRCNIYDKNGNAVSGAYFPVPTIYPAPGRVEQNAEKAIELAFRAVSKALEDGGIQPSAVAALSITAMRNSFVPVDREGNFLTNMFIWQDQRGEAVHPWMRERMAQHHLSEADFYRKNGQPFGTFQCGFKAIWFRVFMEEVYRKTWKLVTPVAFLTHAFGAEEFRDEKNDIGSWLTADADTQIIDEAFCRIFDMDPGKYAEAVSPGSKVGEVSAEAARKCGLLQGTPIYAASGDQQCGAVGAGNYGTSDIMSVCMGTAGLVIAYSPVPVRHPKALCHVQGHPAGGYTIEGHSSSCMSSFRWAKELLFGTGGGEVFSHIEELAEGLTPGSKGVFFLPFLQGQACPYYNDAARGAFIGMSLDSGKGELIRAVMEGISFETKLMLDTLLQADIARPKALRIVGGAANNHFWNKIQADIFGLPVETIADKESTALGAAIIGAVGSGLYPSYKEAVQNMTHVKERFEPEQARQEEYREVYRIWHQCYMDLNRGSYEAIHRFEGRNN